MNNFFVWGKSPSAAKLAGMLGCSHGYLPEFNKHPESIVVIRWGKKLPGNLPADVILNKVRPRNKLHELQMIWKELPKNCVPFKVDTDAIVLASYHPKTLVGRKKKHTKGKDIKFYGEKGFEKSNFWTAWLDKKEEYRVHVIFEKVVRSGKKVGGPPDSKIWNLGNGWTFDYGQTLPKEYRSLAITAVKACRLDFGAVDLIIDQEGKAWVLEVNTSPGLVTNNTATKYAETFKKRFGDG